MGWSNLVGAVTALAYYASCILVFLSRLLGQPQVGHAIGYGQMALAAPLVILIAAAPGLARPFLYYVQVALLLAFLIVETLLDYVLKVDFRTVRWMVIAYVMLFFAATGGMLGVAALAGRAWMIAGVALFLTMAVLTFVQRAVTGM